MFYPCFIYLFSLCCRYKWFTNMFRWFRYLLLGQRVFKYRRTSSLTAVLFQCLQSFTGPMYQQSIFGWPSGPATDPLRPEATYYLEVRGHRHNSLWKKVTVVKEMAWSQPWVNPNTFIMIAWTSDVEVVGGSTVTICCGLRDLTSWCEGHINRRVTCAAGMEIKFVHNSGIQSD